MHSNQSWPPVISPLGVHPCFRNATRAKQGCCRDWQGHTVFVSIVPAGRRYTKSTWQQLWWTILDSRRRVKWMLFTILVPEYLVGKALNDRLSAKRLTRFIREHRLRGDAEWEEIHVQMANIGYYVLHFSRSLDSSMASRKALAEEYPSILGVKRNCEGVKSMGTETIGVYALADHKTEPDSPWQFEQSLDRTLDKEPLTPFLIDKKALRTRYWVLTGPQWAAASYYDIADLPATSPRDLQLLDRGGVLVKSLALLQVSYQVLQVIARWVIGRSSSQLEIAALAFSASSFITYLLFIGRPQGVRCIQLVQAKRIPSLSEVEYIAYCGPNIGLKADLTMSWVSHRCLTMGANPLGDYLPLCVVSVPRMKSC